MQDQNEANQVTNVLKTVPDLKILDLNLDRQQVLLEMSLKTPEGLDQIQRRIESQTGCKTVLKGFGDQMAAVAELRISPLVDSSATCCSKQVLGVARLTQLPGAKCFVDAVIDHLSQSQQSIGLNIHSSGNLSAPDLASVGSVHIPMNGLYRELTHHEFNQLI